MTAITGTAGKPDGTIYASATFDFTRNPNDVVSQGGVVVAPTQITVTSSGAGAVSFALLAGNYIGVESATGKSFTFAVPDVASADWSTCVGAAAVAPTVPLFPASQLSGAILAAQMPALTGDVTTPGASLAATIAAGAVTFAKFQNIMDARLLGRNAGSTGDMQHITLGTGLSFTGTTLNAAADNVTTEI